MRILIVGAHGYIGRAFHSECTRRNLEFHCAASHDCWLAAMDECNAEFVINCAAFVPQPTVDACKDHKSETMRGNVCLPDAIAQECHKRGIGMAHISTGCLYDERREYTEGEEPTRRLSDYAGFYVATKYLSEQLVSQSCPNSYIWRIRLPFDETDHPKNFISKLKRHHTLWHHPNSLTHRGDFVRSALDMIEKRVPFGTYHMTNRGNIDTSTVNGMMIEKGLSKNGKRFVIGPVPGSILSTAKLESTGCGMRPVSDAVAEALKEWRTA